MNQGWWDWVWGKGQGMSPAELDQVESPASGLEVSRRGFLRVGGLGLGGLGVAQLARGLDAAPLSATRPRRAVLVLMNGGPSQLETFDPKPTAPATVRGPMRAIATSVPGVQLSESLPHLAQRMDRCALIRTLHHDAAPIHETGLQLLQTGRLVERDHRFPHVASIVAHEAGWSLGSERHGVMAGRLASTGVHRECGQSSGFLGNDWAPKIWSPLEYGWPEAAQRTYGDSDFGRELWRTARQLEAGSRFLTVNLCPELAGMKTWDCHGDAVSPGRVCDYRDQLCPAFDRALSAFLDDLEHRGLLDDTLVVATGEMGRTPRLNENGGRDHWTNCWSAFVAGGGVTGGTVLGTSDAEAAAPVDIGFTPDQLAATFLAWFGIDGRQLDCPVLPGQPWFNAEPITQLWGSAVTVA